MPKIVDHDMRRAELADVVLDLIAESGIKAVTTRAVAERAGWSTGVVSHYFGSHHGLLLAALRRAAEVQGRMFREARAASGDQEPMARLKTLFRSALPLTERRLAMCRVFLVFYAEAGVAPEAKEEISDYLAAWRRMVLRLVAEAQQLGDIDATLDPHRIATELVALADGFAIHASLDPTILEPFTSNGSFELTLVDGRWRITS
ncbi:TetR/AcrR family transcriptional regulator [Marmoricola sp. RAF53]|uniref:TetR/AcrR family transcriptional regulator n=1 Tax=Marmoricola sp. RAF53 TaxID=3233059 RepID=UPI003F9D7ED7